MKLNRFALHGLAAALLLAASGAQASLTVLQTYSGTVGVSTDGWGSLSQSGLISASVPGGSTVVAAYLYTSTFSAEWDTLATNGNPVGGTFQDNTLNYTPIGYNNNYLMAGRMDVTAWVKPVIDNGSGGVYDFSITETSTVQDGSALVVVYNNPLLPNATVGILDGFSHSLGDTTTLNFAAPLNTTVDGFRAEMRLGIGFSCLGQSSTVKVNGQLLSSVAGNNDDGDGDCYGNANGRLITVGGFDDPFSVVAPAYYNYDYDHERYDLRSFIDQGDLSITIDTWNASYDDNIFLAVFDVSGMAGINEPAPTPVLPPITPVPEPASFVLFGVGFAILLGQQRYRQNRILPKTGLY